jgi:hypothetical protein
MGRECGPFPSPPVAAATRGGGTEGGGGRSPQGSRSKASGQVSPWSREAGLRPYRGWCDLHHESLGQEPSYPQVKTCGSSQLAPVGGSRSRLVLAPVGVVPAGCGFSSRWEWPDMSAQPRSRKLNSRRTSASLWTKQRQKRSERKTVQAPSQGLPNLTLRR